MWPAGLRLHGGHIGVDSEMGKGSSFWFDLPQAVSAGNAMKEVVKQPGAH